MVLLGGLMLADRASDGLISAAFQRDSSDARDATETGLTRIVAQEQDLSRWKPSPAAPPAPVWRAR
jgi:hypothetical protein